MKLTSDIGPFCILPEWLLYSVSASALKVWAVLARHANALGVAFPSIRRISKLTGMATKTVTKAIQELQNAGAITAQHTIDADGGQGVNIYRLFYTQPEMRGVYQMVHGCGKNSHTPVGKITTPPVVKIPTERDPSFNENHLNEKNPPLLLTSPPQEDRREEMALEEAFEHDFWELYPKRAGTNPKAKAKARYMQLVKNGVDPNTLSEAAYNYARHMEKLGHIGTIYVQQAATFLGPQNSTWKDYTETEDETNGR